MPGLLVPGERGDPVGWAIPLRREPSDETWLTGRWTLRRGHLFLIAGDSPMGLRLRLKASYPIGRFHGQARVIVTALKRYGMLVADNGSDWFITGGSDRRWNDGDLNQLKGVPGNAFEVVRSGPIRHSVG